MSVGRRSPLPKFKFPPVVETALSIEFAPIASWNARYFSEFWTEIRDAFPYLEFQPPIVSQPETFDRQPAEMRLVFPGGTRCWFISADDRRLVQLQNDRFVYNWRKGDSPSPYPRYEESIRPAFEAEYVRFLDFLSRHGAGVVEIIQCEVTYINHLEKGKGWESAANFHEVFRFWSNSQQMSFLPSPEDATFEVRYRMPERRGRMRINVQPGIRNIDGLELLQMTLTARGKPAGSDLESAMSWLDQGREWVVRGFADFTTAKMHSIWGREQ
jgi:uncharacterized protein (TIGR04255 family)